MEGRKSLAYSSIAEQMIKPLDRSKIHLNDSLKKDEKDIKVPIYFILLLILILIICIIIVD